MGIDDYSDAAATARAAWVEDMLEDDRFLYANPDDEVSTFSSSSSLLLLITLHDVVHQAALGTFRVKLICRPLALHFKKIEGSSNLESLRFGDPLGAVGLCAAAVRSHLIILVSILMGSYFIG